MFLRELLPSLNSFRSIFQQSSRVSFPITSLSKTLIFYSGSHIQLLYLFAPLQFSAIVAGKLPIPADMKEPSSDDWLPPGWKVEMKLTSTGRKYKVVFASTSLSHSRVSAQFVLIFVAFFLFFSSELWFQFFLLVFGWHFGNWFLELKFLCQFLLLVARNVLWENGEGVIELSDWVFE